MNVSQMISALDLTMAHDGGVDCEITGAMAADLLSDVLANGAPGEVWITVQTHGNVAPVAAAKDLAAVIVTAGREPSEKLLALAAEEKVMVLCSAEETYTVAGRLYALGVR
jgi:predicted transcriptional regulator